MSALLIIVCCLLAASKVTVQSHFAKANIKNQTDALLFNGFIFIFSALIFIKSAFSASYVTMLYAAISGILSVTFQFTYIQALAQGPVSITVLINNLSMMIPIIVSAIVFKEPITITRSIGIILTFATFFLNTKLEKGSKLSAKWLILTFLTFASNGAINVVQKFFTKSDFGAETQAYVSFLYIVAAIVSLILYLIFKAKGEKKTFRYSPNVFVHAALTGIILGVFQFVNTYAVKVIDGTLYFPAFGGGSTLAMTIIGIILFKDKLTKKQMLGTVMGIVAIIFMSI